MASNDFLMALEPHDAQVFTAAGREVVVDSGTDLFLPGDQIDAVYFPYSGLVSLISVLENGDQAETAVIGREGAVGLVEASGSGVMLYRAVVQLETTGLRIPADVYRRIWDQSGSLRRRVAKHSELTIAEARQALACLSHHTVKKRLAWWLLECQDRTGFEALPLTQEFLGAMISVRRTTVVEVANQLRNDGLIDYRRGVIRIIDRPALERACCECYATVANYRHRIEGGVT